MLKRWKMRGEELSRGKGPAAQKQRGRNNKLAPTNNFSRGDKQGHALSRCPGLAAKARGLPQSVFITTDECLQKRYPRRAACHTPAQDWPED
jgi:hypothetical protein